MSETLLTCKTFFLEKKINLGGRGKWDHEIVKISRFTTELEKINNITLLPDLIKNHPAHQVVWMVVVVRWCWWS